MGEGVAEQAHAVVRVYGLAAGLVFGPVVRDVLARRASSSRAYGSLRSLVGGEEHPCGDPREPGAVRGEVLERDRAAQDRARVREVASDGIVERNEPFRAMSASSVPVNVFEIDPISNTASGADAPAPEAGFTARVHADHEARGARRCARGSLRLALRSSAPKVSSRG